MKTTSIILLIPTFGALMMAIYGLTIKDYGLSIAAFAVTVFGLIVSILNNKFYS
jgi:hypothetical protein